MKSAGKAKPGAATAPTVAEQVEGFIDKFEPGMAKRIRSIRRAMRRRLPTAYELVYDNYNFFVIGYASTPRASDCVVSIAAYAKGITLFFYYGAALPDPNGLLRGSGKQVRSIPLESAATLTQPEVEDLIDSALGIAEEPMRESGRMETIVKCIAAKQRPRR
jgi:hypothetical protein